MTARAALANERDRARRVVRVFWRVRTQDGTVVAIWQRNDAALWEARLWPGSKVYRVTVRRKAKT